MPCTDHCSIDLVMEGGGIKGIGLVGALAALHDEGYKFFNAAGTSAGAIVASLLVAGYTPPELKQVIQSVDFSEFLDSGPAWLPRRTRAVYNLATTLGVYRGDKFLEWMREMLAAKGVRTFGDIKRGIPDKRQLYPLRVVASDVTRGRMVILPRDIRHYTDGDGRRADPDRLEICEAVRMSMSIPMLFRPVCKESYDQLTNSDGAKTQCCYIVDGGLLSNFPIELFDGPGMDERPTFGLRLTSHGKSPVAKYRVDGVVSYIKAMAMTAMEAPDAYYLDAHNFVRTIEVDNLGIGPTQFALPRADKERLYRSGYEAAVAFLHEWDFAQWHEVFRDWAGVSRMSIIRQAAGSG